jgi:hypothetical protein
LIPDTSVASFRAVPFVAAGPRITVASLQASQQGQSRLVHLDCTHSSFVKAILLISPLSMDLHTCDYSSSKLELSHSNCKDLYSQGSLKLRKSQPPSFTSSRGVTLFYEQRNHP